MSRTLIRSYVHIFSLPGYEMILSGGAHSKLNLSTDVLS